MRLKKIMAAAAASVMLCTMTACGENTSSTAANDSAASKTESAASEAASDTSADVSASSSESSTANSDTVSMPDLGDKKFKVGICQLVEHDALGAATKGFKEALIDKLGEDHVEFDEQNANNEVTNCTTITTNFVAAGVDLIMANATPALMAAASATDSIPVVGTSITSYDVAFGGDDWKGKNITGASDLAPLDQQADMLTTIFPDAKKVGILYCSSEPNSKYQAENITTYLKEKGVEVKEYTVADSNEIQAQT